MSKKIDNWFNEWFDSDHYHILYKHRNEMEAEEFIKNLFQHLKLDPGSKVLDLACGKGRHALQVHQLGYKVVGLDLSEESINAAKKQECSGLDFYIGDMRELDLEEKFDLTLNLFTSFGYFKVEGENLKVLRGLAQHLSAQGRIVLDYLNVNKTVKGLPCKEKVSRGPIDFLTSKKLEDNFIVKDIEFEDQGKEYHYREYVKNIDLERFKGYFSELGMEIKETFGDYQLNPFNEVSSDRLIMIAQFK